MERATTEDCRKSIVECNVIVGYTVAPSISSSPAQPDLMAARMAEPPDASKDGWSRRLEGIEGTKEGRKTCRSYETAWRS